MTDRRHNKRAGVWNTYGGPDPWEDGRDYADRRREEDAAEDEREAREADYSRRTGKEKPQ